MKIHIVDDSEVFRERMREMLSSLSDVNVVAESDNVEDAVQVQKAHKPDVLLLDLQLKSGSGIDVLRQVASLDRAPLIIVLTSHPEESIKKLCLQLGARYFLDKSTEFEKVVEVIEEYRLSLGDQV